MAARTIVTSHPDVECDVCGRRLLRGEQPDVFLGGGQRRMVCELCTSRATHEGWRRETEAHAAGPRAERAARASSLLRRLRQLREPARPVRRAEGAGAGGRVESIGGAGNQAQSIGGAGAQPEWTGIDAEWAAVEEWGPTEDLGAAIKQAASPPDADRAVADLRRALEVFNAGEHPRRLAGVARALGAPTVRATQSDRGANVAIVVAWELCWYRYEIDPADDSRGAWLAAEGMELEELTAADRVPNSVLDERGGLSLLVG
jgi:hypothetical protein